MLTASIDNRPMRSDGLSVGGWEKSDIRDWLSGSFLKKLPKDLRDVIVTVKKETNNVGETTDLGSVTITKDKLWLLSARELCGYINWGDDIVNDILNLEGSQYQLFQDVEVHGDSGHKDLEMEDDSSGDSVEWWLRSARSKIGSFFYYVDKAGKPHNFKGEAGKDRGVVMGFSI